MKKKHLLVLCIFFSFSTVIKGDYVNQKQESFNVIVFNAKENYYLGLEGVNRYYIYQKNHQFEVGDILKVKGKIKRINFETFEEKFNFKDYLKNKGVKYEIKTSEVKYAYKKLIRVREMISFYQKQIGERHQNLGVKLLFGYQIDEDPISYEGLELFYLFSVSSLHLHFLFEAIKKFLRIKLEDKQIEKVFVGITLILFVISNYKISLLRILLYRVAILCKNNLSQVDKIALVGIMMFLLIRGYFNSSGFFYTFPLLFILIPLRTSIKRVPYKLRPLFYSISIYLFILPLNLSNFYQLSLFSFFYQLFLTPFVLITYLFGAVGLVFPFLFSFYRIMIEILFSFLNVFKSFNPLLIVGEIGFGFLLAYYGVYLLILYLWETRTIKKGLRYFILLFLLISVKSFGLDNYFVESVTFLNVGQGDSILIQKSDINILIDTGGKQNFDISEEVLKQYFKKRQIKKLDALIITHNDYDHNGGKNTLLNLMPIKRVIENQYFQSLDIKGFKIKNLNQFVSGDEDNDKSYVLSFNLLGKSFLLMGDASKKVEKRIVEENNNLQADILKLGHHGSNTSSSFEFLKAVNPQEAIISCGADNMYNHPHSEVLLSLAKLHIKIRRTDLEGSIEYSNIFRKLVF